MSDSPYPTAAYLALVERLQEKDWKHTVCHLERRVTFTHRGRHGLYRYSGCITHEGAYLQFYSAFIAHVTDEKLRPSVAELIVRANFSIQVGRFEIDMDDGQVGFRITHVIGESLVPPEVLECYLQSLIETVDRYYPAFMRHLHDGYTPDDAVFLSEIDLYADRLPDEIETPAKAQPKQDTSRPSAQPHKIKGKKGKSQGRKDSNSQGELPL